MQVTPPPINASQPQVLPHTLFALSGMSVFGSQNGLAGGGALPGQPAVSQQIPSVPQTGELGDVQSELELQDWNVW